MRARMALYQAQMQVEIYEVDLKHKPEEMLKLSPKGLVPVLLLDDGSVIDESLEVMRWALEQNDPAGWLLQKSELARALITENDSSFKQALDRYKYPQRFPEENCSRARDQALLFIERLNASLKGNPYLSGSQAGFADIAIFPFIRQFANVDMTWFNSLPMEPVQLWLVSLVESTEFNWIMQKQRTLLL